MGMKVLVTGAKGQLGRDLMTTLQTPVLQENREPKHGLRESRGKPKTEKGLITII